MKVVFQDHALADLERIHNWIAQDSSANAGSVIGRILDSIENTLAPHPFMGRMGHKPGTREWVVTGLPYLVIYKVDTARQALFVRAVYHGAQRR